MRTYPTTTVKKTIAAFAQHGLDYAHTCFVGAPTADNWRECLKAMLVYQQQRVLVDADYESLRDCAVADLDVAIVMAATGLTIGEAVKIATEV